MKNTIKLMITLVAVIGFSFAACSNGSSDTYSFVYFEMMKVDYEAIFSESVSEDFKILPGTKSDLESKVTEALNFGGIMESGNAKGNGLSYSDLETKVNSYFDYEPTRATEILNELKSNGHVVGVFYYPGDNKVPVFAAYKE